MMLFLALAVYTIWIHVLRQSLLHQLAYLGAVGGARPGLGEGCCGVVHLEAVGGRHGVHLLHPRPLFGRRARALLCRRPCSSTSGQG